MPETLGATQQPLLDMAAVERHSYSVLAETQCRRVQQLVLEMLADRQVFTSWRELMCAVVAAEVMTHLERMTNRS